MKKNPRYYHRTQKQQTKKKKNKHRTPKDNDVNDNIIPILITKKQT